MATSLLAAAALSCPLSPWPGHLSVLPLNDNSIRPAFTLIIFFLPGQDGDDDDGQQNDCMQRSNMAEEGFIWAVGR